MNLLRNGGVPLHLGKELAKGGEGRIYEVHGEPDLVAKVYLHPPDARKCKKLLAMIGLGDRELRSIAVWPKEVLFDPRSKAPMGILMERIKEPRHLHELYNPSLRFETFPRASWKFLVHVAINLADAVRTVHDAGMVIGDINEKSSICAHDGTVRFIDCDSFQVGDPRSSQVFPCVVGAMPYTPPELRKQDLGSILRTKNHDAFGLAVLIFQLVFLGRHPYYGVPLQATAPIPLDEVIPRHAFAFGRDAATRQVGPPPGIILLKDVAQDVEALFERAFSPAAARGGRPKPSDWVVALKAMRSELDACSVIKGHDYHRRSGACPWCRLEGQGVSPYFRGTVLQQIPLGNLWHDIEQVQLPAWGDEHPRLVGQRPSAASPLPPAPDPPPLGPLPPEAKHPGGRPKAPPQAKPMPWQIFALGRYQSAWDQYRQADDAWCQRWRAYQLDYQAYQHALNSRSQQQAQHQALLRQHQQQVAALKASWQTDFNKCSQRQDELKRVWGQTRSSHLGPYSPFVRLKQQLEQTYRSYNGLAARRDSGLAQLERDLVNRQQIAFLQRFPVARARIPQVGENIKAALLSFGISTAADVNKHRILTVPGIGEGRASQLLIWRDKVALGFQPDPSRGVEIRDVEDLDHRLAIRRVELLQELRAGLGKLRELRGLALAAKAELEGQFRPVQTELVRLYINLQGHP